MTFVSKIMILLSLIGAAAQSRAEIVSFKYSFTVVKCVHRDSTYDCSETPTKWTPIQVELTGISGTNIRQGYASLATKFEDYDVVSDIVVTKWDQSHDGKFQLSCEV